MTVRSSFKQKGQKKSSRPGRPGGARDVNRRERVAALEAAALQLYLERGVDSVSVDDITRLAKMAKGGFYRYFADQEALVAALLAPTRAVVVEALEACGRALSAARTKDEFFSAYRVIGEALATLLMEQPGPARLYLQESRGPASGARRPLAALGKTIATHAVSLTRAAQQRGLLRPMTPQVSALAVVGAAERLVLAVLQEEELGNVLEVPDLLVRLVLDGLRA